METLQGHLLIAIPELADPNFFRSVVLVIQHDEAGATGVVLNRPSNMTVAEVWAEVSEQACDCLQPVHVGGPVEGPLIALHSSLNLGESLVLPGVLVSMSREQLDDLVSQTEYPFRLFSGYSGWGPGQLENEISVGGWLIMPAQPEHVFASPDELWKQVCAAVGASVMKAQMGKHVPVDPSLN